MSELNFKKGLYRISCHFSRSEVDKLKFILSDFIPRRKLERAGSAFHVFCLLESHRGLLSPSNLTFFREILNEVHKAHLIEKYLSGSTVSDVPLLPRQQFISDARTTSLLGDLADDLSRDNVRDLGLFFCGETVPLEIVENVSDGVKLFERLKDANVSLHQLKEVLDVLSRKDLVRKIETFMDGAGQGVPNQGYQEQGSTLDTETTYFTSLDDTSLVLSPTRQPTTSMETSLSATSLETDAGGRGEAVMLLRGEVKKMPTQQLSNVLEESDKKISELTEQVVSIKEEKKTHASDASRVKELETLLLKKIEEVQSQMKETAALRAALMSRDDAPVYSMKQQPHGLAVIFVNSKFDKNVELPNLTLNSRSGAKKDEELFVSTFHYLSYQTQVYRNLSSTNMLAVMEKLSNLDHSNYDSLVVCVSSHGNQRAIFGSDSVEVNRDEFCNSVRRCESLKGKPKLFFLQACRLPLVTADSPDDGYMGEIPPTATPLHPDADMLIANASSASNAAYISGVGGSWFANSLNEKLTNSTLISSRTLLQLLQEVNQQVCERVGITQDDGKEVNQCVEVTTRLRKGVRFSEKN